MDSRIANYFMATLRAIADEGKNGPRLFTFRTRQPGFSLKPLFLVRWNFNSGARRKAASILSLTLARVFTRSTSNMSGSNELRRMPILR